MTSGGGRFAVLAFVLVTAACSGEADEPASVPTTTLLGEAVDEVGPGDCLADFSDPSSGRVEVVDCAEAHRAEVYAVHELADGPFPGAAVLGEDAALECAERYGEFAGEPIDPTTALAFSELVPSDLSWADGDRRVVCLALPPGGEKTVGSIADGSSGPAEDPAGAPG
jgi:hypothetical protein